MNKKQKKNIKVLTGVFAAAAGMIIAGAASVSPTYASFAADAKGKFYADFATYEEEQAFAGNLNVKLMEESVTLLKNKDDALPLAKGSNVSLMGIRSYQPVLGGTGSGSVGSQFDPLPDSLENAGFNLNKAIENYYMTSPGSDYRSNVAAGGMFGRPAQPVDGPISDLTKLESSFKFFGDAAVITLGRVGGEGSDLPVREVGTSGDIKVNEDVTKHSLQLYDNEKALINFAKDHCDKVIVLLNTANVMEVAELEDDPGIDAILWIGEPGSSGLKAIGKILNGSANPSGRLADIWPADFTKDPTFFNFGDNSQNNAYDKTAGTFGTEYSNVVTKADGSTVANGNRYALEEEENIYMGYKWYETAAADGVLDKLSIYDATKGVVPEEKAGDKYYNRSTGVVYPFGFGLSYTQFEKEFVSTAAEIKAAVDGAKSLEDVVPVKVRVKNVGKFPGKDVVELYNHAPYTKNGIEKAEVSLAGFEKTGLLKAGRSEIVEVDVRVGDLASFDYNDANKNSFAGWELEAGNYELRLQNNSHECVGKLELALGAKEFKKDGSVATGLKEADSYNVLSKGDDYDTLLPIKLHNAEKDGVTFKLMTRADLVGTFPTAPKAAERVYPDVVLALLTNSSQRSGDTSIQEGQPNYSEWAKYYRYTGVYNGSDDLTTDPWYKTNDDIPASWTQLATDRAAGTQTEVLLSQMSGLDFNSKELVPDGHPYAGKTQEEAWNLFMNQLTYAELAALLVNGGYRTPGLNAIGKKQACDNDGPAALNGREQTSGNFTVNSGDPGTSWCCEVNISSSWNTELANKQGTCVGNESLFHGATGWYGPAMNTHRNPFSGRNFEYYSQDGVHGGIIAGAVVAGAQSKGCNVFMKHYAMNDQETNRMEGIATYASEQAIRENLLKPFEYATKVGHATAVMTAFNRSGSIPAFANYMFNEEILRQEWGFMGESVTDFYSASLGKANYLQRGGCHLALNTNLSYNRNATGTRTNSNAITGVWDPELRGGKGGVRDGLSAGDPAVIPESPTQYYAIRMAATYICWVGANSNSIQNGVTTVGATDNTTTPANIFAVEGNPEVEYGKQADINCGIAAEHKPEDVTAVYTLSGTLPRGLSFNANTGHITGSPAELGTFRVTVVAVLDNYMIRSTTFNVVVKANVTAALNEQVYIKINVYAVGDNYNGNTLTAVQNPAVSGISGAEIVELDADAATAAGLTTGAGTYIKCTSDVDGQFTIRSRQRVSYQGMSGTSNANYDQTFVVIFGEPAPAPVVPPVSHGGIVSAVINDRGELVITYEDNTVVNLGVVVGANGQDGQDGLDGLDGVDGKDGKDGANGADGKDGINGQDGKDGVNGKDGTNGSDGAAAKGCGGSIAAASGVMALIAGLGLAAISLKRNNRKED